MSEKIKNFSKRLLQWKDQFGRVGLPWQNVTDPYRVWLSEIMLQQTQVATVIERYQEFLIRFPTVFDLATAKQEDVMSLWAGLGYYTRARNLWACAQKIATQYQGIFPQTAEELETLPGIGRSTAAAIAAFCYQERIPILDGNVKRVLSRVFGIDDPINQSSTEKRLWKLAQEQLPQVKEKMPAYTQALMDFGATVCTPSRVLCQQDQTPNIRQCIFIRDCRAHQLGRVSEIPVKNPKKRSPIVHSGMLLVMTKDAVLLTQRSGKGIWGGLWTLPETAWLDTAQKLESIWLDDQLDQFQGLEVEDQAKSKLSNRGILLAPLKHVFTHRVLYFQVKVIQLKHPTKLNSENLQWIKKEEVKTIGLPTPIKKLLLSYL